MPYISTEALVAGAFVLVLAFGWHYMPNASGGPSSSNHTKAGTKKKNKKKRPAHAAGAAVNGADVSSKTGSEADGERSGRSGVATPSEGPIAPGEIQQGGAAIAAKPKTLAEKLAPKPRKTKVDDMLAPEDRGPSYARVMTINQPSASSAGPSSRPAKPAVKTPTAVTTAPKQPPAETSTSDLPPSDTGAKVPSFEGDYASDSSEERARSGGSEEDDGWNVVPAKAKKPVSLSIGGSATPTSTQSRDPGELTKLQRKNAKKADAKKAARAAEEEDRQRRLKMHKREQEREKINELYSGNSHKKTERAKALSGGQHATVSSSGKLIWE